MSFPIRKSVVGLMLALVSTAQAGDFPRLDEALPKGGNTARYAPVFDFDGDVCLPAAPLSRTGAINDGARAAGVSQTSHCRHGAFLDYSNTLHRWACVEDNCGSNYCGHVYEMYFEKDQTVWGSYGAGHRHDLELVTVWTKDGVITHANYSVHGGRPTSSAADLLFWGPAAGSEELCLESPEHPVCWGWGPVPDEREHAMIVYHSDWSSGGTHAFRFAHIDDASLPDPENPEGRFVTPTVSSWYQMRGDYPLDSNSIYRYWFTVSSYSFGSAHFAITPDQTFLAELNKHSPWDSSGLCYPEFTLASLAAANPNNPVLTFVDGDGDLLGEDTEYVLDFGTVARSFGTLSAELAVGNDVAEAADRLDGGFDTTGAAPYMLSGFGAFTGLEAGDSLEGFVVELATAGLGPGVVSREIVFQPKGLVDTGFREPSDPITLNLRVDIVNEPPVADAGPDQTVECTSPDGATTTLDGTGSFDPDSDPIVEYVWTGSFGTAFGPMPTVPFPFGTETVSLVVYDDAGAVSEPDTMQVTVQDTVAPEMALTTRPAVLWPPNGKMVPVRIEPDAMDACDAAPVCMITEVSSSEGRMIRPDWQVKDHLSLELRAERKGKGSGRTYSIGVECRDRAGNRSMDTTQVLVPHDRSKKK
jgi:hypothetical protein